MNSTTICAALITATTIFQGQAIAQERPKPPAFVPVEAFTCSYNKGKTRADLDRVVDKWSKWMDDNHATPYNAWIMSPQYAPADLGFDVAWFGAWPDGKAMGEGSHTWFTKGAAMNDEFNNVISCAHASFASVNVKAPAAGEPPKQSLTRFSDCKLTHGRTMQQASAAIREWAAYQTAQGSDSVMWMFFPAFGAGKVDFDFKMVVANPSYQSLGNDYELYGNGGGYMKASALFDGLLDCDSPRVYDSTMVRHGFGMNN